MEDPGQGGQLPARRSNPRGQVSSGETWPVPVLARLGLRNIAASVVAGDPFTRCDGCGGKFGEPLMPGSSFMRARSLLVTGEGPTQAYCSSCGSTPGLDPARAGRQWASAGEGHLVLVPPAREPAPAGQAPAGVTYEVVLRVRDSPEAYPSAQDVAQEVSRVLEEAGQQRWTGRLFWGGCEVISAREVAR
jgi:hypothetical protein